MINRQQVNLRLERELIDSDGHTPALAARFAARTSCSSRSASARTTRFPNAVTCQDGITFRDPPAPASPTAAQDS